MPNGRGTCFPGYSWAAPALARELVEATHDGAPPDLLDRGRAWASVAAGEVSRVRELLGEAARRAALGHLWVAEAHLLHDSARLGAPELAAIRLAELAAILDSKLIDGFALHAGALVRRSAPELESAAAGFGALGAWLLAAEASTAAAVGPGRGAFPAG